MSGSVSQSLGILRMIWGGQKLPIDAKSSSFTIGGYVGEAVVAGETIFIANKFMPGTAMVSLPLSKGLSIAKLQSFNGTELQLQCDSGQTYTCSAASLTKDIKIKAGPGNNVSLEFSGLPFAESLP